MFVTCCCVLVLKKVQEKSQRTWHEFFLDSSKQMAGAGWIHVMNILCAKLLDHMMPVGDECEWYWINIMIDTTLGVAVEYALLQALLKLAGVCLGTAGAEELRPGHYHDAGVFQVSRYVKQLVLWLIVVTGMKMSMVVLMYFAATPLEAGAAFVLQPFLESPSLKLCVVMIATPLCMNAFQFWVVDNFIKKEESEGYAPTRECDE